MNIQLLGRLDLPLQPSLQWLWCSNATGAVVSGDDQAAYSVSIADPTTATPVGAGVAGKSACNLPVSDALKDEFLSQSWHGLRFLGRDAYDGTEGDILRTLVFGPDYGVPMVHPSSGSILSLRSRALELLARDGDGFKPTDKAKPRGKSALAFAAHPTETLLVYGDNAGTFTAHRFEPAKFGKATKIAEKQRNASQVDFIIGGTRLLIGGMGYLATFAYEGKTLSPLHEVSIPVRGFVVGNDGQTIVVNQGMHGVSVYRYDEAGFAKQAEAKPAEPVQFVVASDDLRHLALTHQGRAGVSVYSLS